MLCIRPCVNQALAFRDAGDIWLARSNHSNHESKLRMLQLETNTVKGNQLQIARTSNSVIRFEQPS